MKLDENREIESDPDLIELTKRWQQQASLSETTLASANLAHARRHQFKQRLLLCWELFGALVMGTFAIWLMWRMPGWLSAFSAVFLLLGVVGSIGVSWLIHRPILDYAQWTSHGVLQFREKTGQLMLLYYRYNQGTCLFLMLFVIVLTVLNEWRPNEVPAMLLKVYQLIVLPACIALIVYFRRKHKEKINELARLQSLKIELDEE